MSDVAASGVCLSQIADDRQRLFGLDAGSISHRLLQAELSLGNGGEAHFVEQIGGTQGSDLNCAYASKAASQAQDAAERVGRIQLTRIGGATSNVFSVTSDGDTTAACVDLVL